MKHIDDRFIFAYLEGEVTPSDRAALEAEIERSPAFARRVESARELCERVRDTPPELENLDLVAEWDESTFQSRASARRWRPGWRSCSIAAAVLASLSLHRFVSPPPPTAPEATPLEFSPKGSSSPMTDAEARRWLALEIYRLDPEHDEVRPVRGPIDRDEGLLLAYVNAAPDDAHYRYLMVYATDPEGRVHWYFPAHETDDTDPASIPITATRGAARELPAVVRHALQPGPLTLHALFSHQPHRVSVIEHAIQSGADIDMGRVLPASMEVARRLEVRP